MKKSLLAVAVASALLAPQMVGAEGFGIVEWSAQGTAMGGARMFAENDPAMVAYNPASITKVKNGAFSINATMISPHGKYDTDSNIATGLQAPYPSTISKPTSGEHNRVAPGIVPGMYFVKKVGEKDWVGIGTFTRYGMISEFERGSVVSISSAKAKMDGISITPVYAHKFDKKWAAAAGAEINYVGLIMEKNMAGGYMGMDSPFKVQGETWAMGWNAAVNYAFDDKNEIGLVYRSKISQNMQNADIDMPNPLGDNPARLSGKAGAKVVLPDTWSIGYNHKFNDRTRVELNAMRVNWHTYESLAMNITTPYGSFVKSEPKNWEDGWRYAIGVEHKLSKKYNLLAGFSYDGSCIPESGADFMVPTGNRKTITIGAEYHDEKQSVAFTVGYMMIGCQDIKFTNGKNITGTAHTYNNNAPIFSIGYQYNF